MLTSRMLRSFLLAVLVLPACGGGGETARPVARHEPVTVASEAPAPAPVTPPAPIVDAPKPEVVATAPMMVTPREIPTKYADALAQGKQLAAQGDALGARELLEAAAKLDRKAAAPHIELARLFITSGERGLAMAAANKAVKLAPDSSQAWNTLGRAQLARFSYDDAVAAFTKATELDATNAWAWNNLGFAQLEQKHYAEAVDALAHATSLADATGYMWNNLGTAYEQLGQLDEARAAFAAGGKLGSGPALASAKRLVGVASVVAVGRSAPATPAEAKPEAHEYDSREPEPAAEPDATPPVAAPASDDSAADGSAAPAPAPDAGVDESPKPATQTL